MKRELIDKLSERERIIYYYNNLVNNSEDEIIEYRFGNNIILHIIFTNRYYVYATYIGGNNVEISKSQLIKLLSPYMRNIKLEKICSRLEIK